MFRTFACVLALAAGAAARAGELDRETVPTAAPPTVRAASAGGSELDRESPQSAHGWRWGYPYHAHWGWGGYSPFRFSYFGYSPAFYSYSWYRPFGFYGYYGAFAYPYYSAYYAPFGYPYWW